jgi:hypothetical protein
MVPVMRDDVTDALQSLQRSCLYRKGVVSMEQKIVEVEQLAALSLPSHPDALAGIENSMTMEEEERAAFLIAVFGVQVIHALHCKSGQGIGIFVQRPRLFVGKIGQESEVNVRILIREITSFQFIE